MVICPWSYDMVEQEKLIRVKKSRNQYSDNEIQKDIKVGSQFI